jgi:dTDP-4-dehydrorhamnose 3,5-epimerase
MRFELLPIGGAFRIELEPTIDNRGFFVRSFCADAFAKQGLKTDFVQRSFSHNYRRGTVRGLHYQAPPHSETKIVRCTRGAAFDVIVDVRIGSPTFGRWQALELTADNHIMTYVPPGCAHGFQTLADNTEIYYEITPNYVASATRGIRWDDPGLAIPWPVSSPIISERDERWPFLVDWLAHKEEPLGPNENGRSSI